MEEKIEPNIDIVTCFFDIGRGSWEGNGLPFYLKRTTDEYFKNFERLLKLENRIVVFTSNDLLPRFHDYQNRKPNLVVIGFENWRDDLLPEIKNKIIEVHKDPSYITKINIDQRKNPEYWNSDYVLVNFLKSYFVNYAIESKLVENNMVAWLDFAYAKDDKDVPDNVWNYNFDPEQIHLFTIKPSIPYRIDILDVTSHNTVFIQGCHIVMSKENWRFFLKEVYLYMNKLMSWDLVDDDQTIYLMAYIMHPERYEIHYLDERDGGWFQVLRKYNT